MTPLFLYCIENHSLFNYIIQFVRLPGKLPVKVYFLCVIKRSRAFAPFLSGVCSFFAHCPESAENERKSRGMLWSPAEKEPLCPVNLW